jgi:hypothetical protein
MYTVRSASFTALPAPVASTGNLNAQNSHPSSHNRSDTFSHAQSAAHLSAPAQAPQFSGFFRTAGAFLGLVEPAKESSQGFRKGVKKYHDDAVARKVYTPKQRAERDYEAEQAKKREEREKKLRREAKRQLRVEAEKNRIRQERQTHGYSAGSSSRAPLYDTGHFDPRTGRRILTDGRGGRWLE